MNASINEPPQASPTTTRTTPTTTAPTTTSTPSAPTVPVVPKVTAISVTGTIAWCQDIDCHYPTARLQFALNHATTVRLLLRTRQHGHWQQAATARIHAHQGVNRHRLAGRWHGHLSVATGPVQILVQIQHNGHWTTAKTIRLTVRHT